jgi:16S rRNA (guanine527-N7)-methyltransferase
MNNHHQESTVLNRFNNLIAKYNLTQQQADQLGQYLDLLIEWNEKFNLTAITAPEDIIQYHFDDSLALAHCIDFTKLTTIADIGTGAGFPGLPLKILYPHLNVILIEVNNKKRTFLSHVINTLQLQNITLYAFDWRTFLRATDYQIDYFFARASLQPEELVRIFKPSSPYQNATLVYWASTQWTPAKIEAPFVEKEIVYKLDDISRKFIFFAQK